jgi:hypothetical protein
MEDKAGRIIKNGDIVMLYNGTSLWMKLLYHRNHWYVLDSYNFYKRYEDLELGSKNPLDYEIVGNELDTPWDLFATYDKSRNENLDYSIKIKDYSK